MTRDGSPKVLPWRSRRISAAGGCVQHAPGSLPATGHSVSPIAVPEFAGEVARSDSPLQKIAIAATSTTCEGEFRG